MLCIWKARVWVHSVHLVHLVHLVSGGWYDVCGVCGRRRKRSEVIAAVKGGMG